MSIPIPSEERSLRPRRFRGDARHVQTETPACRQFVHADETRRQNDIHTFETGPATSLPRFGGQDGRGPPKTTLKHIPPPKISEHPNGRRNPHRVPPLSESVQQTLYPPGGMDRRPQRDVAATCMEHRSDEHVIFAHLSPQGRDRSHQSKRVFRDSHARSTKGDASLHHAGVKRVDVPVRNPDPSSVPGFHGLGAFSKPKDHPSGKKSVTPQPWDPIHYFEQYGRRHPPPQPACIR